MSFQSLLFLAFFALTAILYAYLPRACRPFVLLCAGVGFCLSWGWWMILPLAGEILISYLSALGMEKAQSPKTRRLLLTAGWILLFGTLFGFKYADWLIRGLTASSFSFETDLLLPVGISFYTLQAAGYLADVYHGRVPFEKNFLYHALFLSYFPQMLAGPISRASDLIPALKNMRNVTWDGKRALTGLRRMLFGFFEKCAVADLIGLITANAFDSETPAGGPLTLLSVFLFSLQILCDFRGYCHIALGMSGFLGIPLAENFNDPYAAYSVQDFWRRWHITLSTWFKDYVYIPIGGSHVPLPRWMLNILIVFLLSGLWHGAALTFAVWGLLHALFQWIERGLFRRKKPQTPVTRVLRTAGAFLAVTFAWIFFRAPSLTGAFRLIGSLATAWTPETIDWAGFASALGFGSFAWIPPVLALALFISYRLLLPRLGEPGGKEHRFVRNLLTVLILFMTVFAFLYLRMQDVPSVFLYAQF